MGYSAAQAKEFINHIAPIIKTEGTRRGYNIVSTTIAQAIIEGAAGTSSLAKNYHNHFGMKCGKSWKGKSVNMKTKEEYTVGNLTTIKDNFRVYDDDTEGVSGYYDFISTKKYENLKYAKDYKQFAEYLKADGYATSSSYINTLCNTVKKYNLYVWDNMVNNVPNNPGNPTIKYKDRNEYVRIAQNCLKLKGYNIAVDGIFGSKTLQAVKEFQKKQGLVVDGIVGPNTWAKLL